MTTYDYNIKGRDSRGCCVEGCEWRDNMDNKSRYGVYLPDGKHYCPKHAREVEERLKEKPPSYPDLSNQ